MSSDSALHQKIRNGVSWTSLYSLVGGLLSPPTVVVRGLGLVNVYVVIDIKAL